MIQEGDKDPGGSQEPGNYRPVLPVSALQPYCSACSAAAGRCFPSSSSAFVRKDGVEEFRLVFCQNLTSRSSL